MDFKHQVERKLVSQTVKRVKQMTQFSTSQLLVKRSQASAKVQVAKLQSAAQARCKDMQ